VLTLKHANIQRKAILTTCIMCSVAATAILLAATLIPTYEASAQIIPSSPQSSVLPENLQSYGGLLSQDAADLAQNSTTANITQLATVLPVAEPITPPITAVNEASDESDETSNSDDDDDENNSSSSNDNDDDDTGNDDDDSDDDDSGDDNNDGDGGTSAASGGAFAIAG
jgi:hypothetical protein